MSEITVAPRVHKINHITTKYPRVTPIRVQQSRPQYLKNAAADYLLAHLLFTLYLHHICNDITVNHEYIDPFLTGKYSDI